MIAMNSLPLLTIQLPGYNQITGVLNFQHSATGSIEPVTQKN
jgi:hypothetical protein